METLLTGTSTEGGCTLTTTTQSPTVTTTESPEHNKFRRGKHTNYVHITDSTGNGRSCPPPEVKRCVHRNFDRCTQLYRDTCEREGVSYHACSTCINSRRITGQIRSRCLQAKSDESGDSC